MHVYTCTTVHVEKNIHIRLICCHHHVMFVWTWAPNGNWFTVDVICMWLTSDEVTKEPIDFTWKFSSEQISLCKIDLCWPSFPSDKWGKVKCVNLFSISYWRWGDLGEWFDSEVTRVSDLWPLCLILLFIPLQWHSTASKLLWTWLTKVTIRYLFQIASPRNCQLLIMTQPVIKCAFFFVLFKLYMFCGLLIPVQISLIVPCLQCHVILRKKQVLRKFRYKGIYWMYCNTCTKSCDLFCPRNYKILESFSLYKINYGL